MDLDLLNYINVDMKWIIMKKSRTGITRRPRKLGTGSFETNKTGTEKVVSAPLKKRRLSHQPPSQILCLNGEVVLSPGPQTPAVLHEDSGQRWKSQKTKSKSGLRKSNILKRAKKEVIDFSGIELLAAAACSSLVNDNADDVSAYTTPGVDSCNMMMRSDKHDNGKEEEEFVKDLRLHWDLNTVMDEWEKPCDDDLSVKLNLEVCEREVVVSEEGSMVNEVCVKHGGENLCWSETKMIGSKTSDGESSVSVCKSGVVDPLIHLDLTTSDVKVEEQQQQPVSEEGCGSNVTQAEGDSVQVDYDSPFEDGELREPILSEKVKEGQGLESQSSSLVKQDAAEADTLHIGDSNSNSPSGRDLGVGKSMGREYVSSVNSSMKSNNRSLDNINCNPKGGGYRRPSASGYGSNRGPPFRRRRSPSRDCDYYRGRSGFHSQEYHDPHFDRIPRSSPNFNRPRSRSRSGSPIAWNFQKRKNLHMSITRSHVSPQRSSKCIIDDPRFREKRPSRRFEPERLKPDDHFRFAQRSARFSQISGHKYKDNSDASRKHDEKENRVRRFRYAHRTFSIKEHTTES